MLCRNWIWLALIPCLSPTTPKLLMVRVENNIIYLYSNKNILIWTSFSSHSSIYFCCGIILRCKTTRSEIVSFHFRCWSMNLRVLERFLGWDQVGKVAKCGGWFAYWSRAVLREQDDMITSKGGLFVPYSDMDIYGQ